MAIVCDPAQRTHRGTFAEEAWGLASDVVDADFPGHGHAAAAGDQGGADRGGVREREISWVGS